MTSDPEAAAIARGEAMKRRLLRDTILLTEGLLASEIATTAGAVDELRRQGRVLAVEVDGAWRYPAWQVRDRQLLPGLADLLAAVAAIPIPLSSWVALAFLVAPDAALDGVSVAHLLRAGRVDEALSVARHYGEMGR